MKHTPLIRPAVARAIAQQGLTQIELAKATGITQGTISAFLSGSRGLSLPAAERLMRAVGLTVSPAPPPPAK